MPNYQEFTEYYEQYKEKVYSFFHYRISYDNQLVEDLTSDTFIKAFDKLATYRGPGSFGPWLSRIATTQFLQLKRKEGTARMALAELGIDDVPVTRPAEAAALDLDKALAQLKPDERTVVVLCFGEGMSHSETADATGMPLGTVKSHALRGRNKLRHLLGE